MQHRKEEVMEEKNVVTLAKEVPVIEITLTVGDGEKSPITLVKQYWTKDGKFIGMVKV